MDKSEINLQDILYVIIKGWKVILTSVLFCVLIAFVYTNLTFLGGVWYATNASMVINTKTYTIIDGKIQISSENNVYLSQKMVNTYSVILLSDNVLEKVNLDLGIDIPPAVMKSWLAVTSPKDTEVIMVSVKNQDPQLAADIANSIMRVAPQVIRETVDVGSINVLDEAKVPASPLIGRSNGLLNMSIGAILGLLLGGFIVMRLDFLIPKLKNKIEMVDKLSINCLGEIPHAKNFNKNNKNPLITNRNADPSFVEGYKNLTEMVMHSSEKSNAKTMIVISAVPGEGKTSVSVNLALSMALAGKKVLLVDFDCYKKGVMELFDLRPKNFLIDILDGYVSCIQGVIEDPKTGLHIIFSDKDKLFGMNLINSLNIKEFFKDAKKGYDYIIVDTPSAIIQSEAVSLTKYIDGVILVVKQETATISGIINTMDKFKNVGAKIIGGVLNDIRYLVGAEYNNKYYHSQNYHYYGNKEKHSERTLLKKIICSILFLLMVFSIVYFATITGEGCINE